MTRSVRVWPLFVSCAIGIAIYGVAFAILGTLLGLPQMQARLQIDATHKGSIFLLLYAGVFLSNVVIGPIVEAFGYKRSLALAAMLVSFSLVWFSVVHSFGAGAGAAMLLGFGGGALNVSVNALVSDIFPHRRGSMLNLLGVFFGVGGLSLPLAAAALLSHVGIAPLFRIAAVLPVGAGILYGCLDFPVQRSKRGIPLLDAARVLRYPGVLNIGLLLFFENANEAVVAAWTSIYAISLGCTPRTATLILSCYWASLMTGRAAASQLIRIARKMTIIFVAATGAIAGCSLLFVARTPFTIACAVILTGLSFAPIYKTTLSIAGDRYPQATAPIFGVVFAMSLLGAMGSPWLEGQISQHLSIRYGPIVPITGSICVWMMALVISRTQRVEREASIPLPVGESA